VTVVVPRDVLAVLVPLEKGEVDEEAIRVIPTTSAARQFVASARNQPASVQGTIAAELRDDACPGHRRAPHPARGAVGPVQTLPRMAGLIAALRRLLNVEGYPVLTLHEDSDTVTLNRALLDRQFQL
jgi:hypothetical protein